MICMVLAAGYATRLYPLTEHFPKPLLPVREKPILDWLLEDIDKTGEISRYVVVSNHKYAEHFNAWAEKAAYRAPVSVLDDGTTSNETRLGAVRDIQFAIDEAQIDEDLLVIVGDNLLDFSLRALLGYAKQADANCLFRYRETDVNRLKKCGVMEVGENDRVLRMEEKPEIPFSEWCAPPFYFYRKGDLPLVCAAIASGVSVDAPGSLMAWMAQKTTVRAMEMPGRRYDIGTLESYKRVCESYRGIGGAL